MKLIYFFIGGVAGIFARYFLSGAVSEAAGASFPYGTLTVNLAGCFTIGIFASLSDEKIFLSPEVKLLLMAGFCGAFTTFSALILDTSALVKNGENLKALGNILISVLAGFALFRVGYSLGKLI